MYLPSSSIVGIKTWAPIIGADDYAHLGAKSVFT